MPELSLILCSRNGSRTIKRCLDHIQAMDEAAEIEVVLIDNGSTDDTRAIMRSFCELHPNLWRTIEETRPGNSAGRNSGIEHSSGEIVLFIDDDCYPEKAFAVAWKEIFNTNPDLGFGSGRIMPFDSSRSPIGCNTSATHEPLPPATFFRRGFVQGSNMAFRKQCLLMAGFFDDRFGAGTPFAGEEWDLALRASFAGWRGGYFPQPGVAHDHGRSEGDASVRGLYYDIGAGAVYAKHVLSSHAPAALLKLAGEIFHSRNASRMRSLAIGALKYYSVAAK
ncbi:MULTISPECIES: glycosyltransferase family 2 protein [Bradyrhizobium]|uniref:glycosyltransferase family 2 protein n=1 Tax=Bradyrhizobium TaxID=374 RepID=UPI00293EFA2C|nr:glycosyltransferase family A protein [Bradyrhizobium sp. BWC-3-1]WOH57320.1 glycosyltransferase family A protein [Bradyrhizobium sp. BWC-3-1]